MEVKVYKKGIVVLPLSVRERINIREGSRLEVEIVDNAIVLRPKSTLLEAFGVDDKETGKRLVKELEEDRRVEIEKESSY
ncbi:AbrB/MazE/SpoVT family DNA-binding domain-containing protein [Metallosphaera tengchongensis]|uniref:AbrB/MazE/SpoVT family DNA-binding domain-containing protein n=1 Tax=Metallosphaera tengchongensis TaxID=1532350 RepID=A0A6N0NZR8_9CREN|nr:AbrB/MazE/SpoVT family DNA-binding domain-containing protein [Metallosphaera tengchongensis]QKR00631.1 AbrB/MazE/SpoVT family DNA-binding domain-containing protein [Metallosphaera tengchongensis]